MNSNVFPPTAATPTRSDTQFLSRHFTKVLIQEVPTRRYYHTSGVWTPDIDKASDFRTGSAALEHALRLKLLNVQLVVTQEFKSWQIIPLKSSVHP